MGKLYSESLVKVFKRRRVVDQVSIEVNCGEIVGLLGPNGAGKTTTFYMIIGFVTPNKGTVQLDDSDITGLPMYKRSRRGIGYLAQEPSIFRKLTVEDNLKAIIQMQPLSRQERTERLESLLEQLDVARLRKSYAYTLSGGERRRVEIARALVTRPNFLLLDEPFAGIDPIAVEDIQSIIAGLRKENLGILITDHNVRETLSITDRAYIMCEGRILKTGTSQFLADDPEARKIYLGEKFRLN
ncbi:MAG: LPS export ABC transporter ATP-binding protein [candidate division Zixibacteria bacterium]|nr:LPS export ABC transporter ATP-binding protein [candidate division Zixibacteria bacterium]MBU1469990.1 LPS export ABC transporter ATP-binding protein [candidate division Zixibacteria bacterium]MBU2626170.1 LPS export ABC transporter ATP-binding protein [candidate division Zixibacteria bacterium]